MPVRGAAQTCASVPISQETLEALARFDAIAANPALSLDMTMQPGDIQLVNNYTVLHSHTAFVDHPEPDKKRHMVRLWLRFLTLKDQYAGVTRAVDRQV